MKRLILTASILGLLLSGCSGLRTFWAFQTYEITLADSNQIDTTNTRVTRRRDSEGRPAELLSAFYGLDDALPRGSGRLICEGAYLTDGMPVIFSHEIDLSTIQAGDFKVTTASGKTPAILCATLAPADDAGELCTALLAGHYGSLTDQPVRVEIVGNILSMNRQLNFKGAKVDVIPLEAGPTMVWAEAVPENEWYLDRAASALPFGGGSGCPAGTQQIVRAVWAGGITKPGGAEVDDVERSHYKVTVLRANGKREQVTPFALSDLGDGDNNHKLCLDTTGTPQSVSFPAGLVTDPREDLNPATAIQVQNYSRPISGEQQDWK